ncbi:hypothetical protein RhiTH_004713 [Rhizoctonia solani]
MKFTASALALITGLGVVSANPLLQKRASASDSAPLGYATLSGGTTGGGSATPVTVTTLDELKAAVTGNSAKVIIISGSITGNEVVKVGSNTSVLGKSGAALNGVGLRVLDVSNVIIRNLKVYKRDFVTELLSKVLADAGDAIGVQAANRVWIDSLELWSDKDHNKDYYDGLLDITHGCYAVTVTNSYLHDHWKASLVGHSDNNKSEDLGIQVTYAYNNFLNNQDGINTRVGAELLVQNNIWEGCKNSVYSTDNGYANLSGNDYGGKAATALTTTWSSVGYGYNLKDASEVKGYVESVAGAKLSF